MSIRKDGCEGDKEFVCSLRVLVMITDRFLPRSWKNALAASFLEVERGDHTFKKTKGSPISLKALLNKLIREKENSCEKENFNSCSKTGATYLIKKFIRLFVGWRVHQRVGRWWNDRMATCRGSIWTIES